MRIKAKQTVTFLSIGLLLMSSYSSFADKVKCCLDDCCDCHHDEIIYSKDLLKNQITNFGPKIVFNSDSIANYGEITVQANYRPKGSITDTIWSSSDASKVTTTPIANYSNICKLTAISKFTDEVIITAQSRKYSDIKFSCKAIWKSSLQITPLVSNLILSTTRTYNCPASYSTNYMSKALSQLFSINGNTQGLTYSLNNSNAVISGSDVKANSIINNSTCILTAIAIDDNSVTSQIPITITYSSLGNSSSHSYQYSTCITRYETTTSYGDWVIDNDATCTTAGSKHRTKIINKLRYDNDKYVCKFCGDYYWSGEYHNSAGDSTSTTTETSSISALGHNWIAQYGGKCPVCGRTYPYPGFKCPVDGAEAVSYLKGYVCSRCGATK